MFSSGDIPEWQPHPFVELREDLDLPCGFVQPYQSQHLGNVLDSNFSRGEEPVVMATGWCHALQNGIAGDTEFGQGCDHEFAATLEAVPIPSKVDVDPDPPGCFPRMRSHPLGIDSRSQVSREVS
jgi:hypothetical protein